MANPEILDNDATPLFIGDVATRQKTILTDAIVIEKGTLLGVITTGGKLKATESDAVDGSEIPKYVATQEIDATGGDVDRDVASWGRVNENNLVFRKSGDDIETPVNDIPFFDHLRTYGILPVATQNLDQFDNS